MTDVKATSGVISVWVTLQDPYIHLLRVQAKNLVYTSYTQ